MLIIRDTTGVTVKRRIQDCDHVRFGVTEACEWVNGIRRNVRPMPKPHGEITIDECKDALEQMERTARMVY